MTVITINFYIIIVSNLHPPPEDIYLADVRPGRLVFSWTASECSTTIYYDITTDCGTCPVVTNTTTATCSSLQLSTSARLCHFRVSSVACDLSGNPSSPVAVTLKGNSGSQRTSHIDFTCLFFYCSSQCSPSGDYSQLFQLQSNTWKAIHNRDNESNGKYH